MTDDKLRQRGQRKLLRVTMPDGKVICHKNALMTFTETLSNIGSDHFDSITTQNCHLPLLSREIYPKYRDYMKHVADGWYVNTQSDTEQKYMQLISIKKQLGIDMNVEIGTDFHVSSQKKEAKERKRNQRLRVVFPDGEEFCDTNSSDTFVKTIRKIGLDKLFYKGIEYSGRALVTNTNRYQKQIEAEKGRWLSIPPSTKERYKALDLINSTLRLQMKVIYFIDESQPSVLKDKTGRGEKAAVPLHTPSIQPPIEAKEEPTEKKEIVVNFVDPEELYNEYPEMRGRTPEQYMQDLTEQKKAEQREKSKAQREKRKAAANKDKRPDTQLEIIFPD